jgi:hypothetical protein
MTPRERLQLARGTANYQTACPRNEPEHIVMRPLTRPLRRSACPTDAPNSCRQQVLISTVYTRTGVHEPFDSAPEPPGDRADGCALSRVHELALRPSVVHRGPDLPAVKRPSDGVKSRRRGLSLTVVPAGWLLSGSSPCSPVLQSTVNTESIHSADRDIARGRPIGPAGWADRVQLSAGPMSAPRWSAAGVPRHSAGAN